MPDLPDVEQKFIADLSEYLFPLRTAIEQTIEFSEKVTDAVASCELLTEAVVGLDDVLEDLIATAGEAGREVGDLRDSMLTTAAAEGHARDESAQLAAILRMLTYATESVEASEMHLSEVTEALGIIQRNTADASLDLMLQVQLLTESLQSDRNAAFAAALSMEVLQRQMEDLGGTTTRAAGQAAASGVGWRIWGLGLNLGATAIHGIISGVIEFMAIVIPAAVAAGAWAAVWAQGAQNVYSHMEAVYTASEATYNMFHRTAGQAVGLGDALQKAQNAANPDVYQALGAAINIVREHFGNLAQTGLEVGQIFDKFTAKLVFDMSSAGGAGSRVNDVLSAMVPDLVQLGQVFGNLARAVLNLASDMPGAANMLLDFLDTVSHLIEIISELPKWLIETVFALHEFNTWGSVAAAAMGRLGLVTGEATGSFFGVTRAVGLLKNIIGLVPTAMYQLGNVIGVVGGKLPIFSSQVKAAGAALAETGEEAQTAVIGLSTLETLGIAAVVIGFGILIDKIATAKTTTGDWIASLNTAVNKTGNLNAFNTIADGIGRVNKEIEANQAALASAQKQQMTFGGFIASLFGGGGDTAMVQATARLAAYEKELAQLRTELVNVGVGATYLSQKYGTTLPGAMELAQLAGVSLTNSLRGNGAAAIIARTQIADLVRGYIAMGQPAGVVGRDMTAIAISAGIQSSKVQQLNQAWDTYMQTITAGTAGLGSFEQSITGLTTGTNRVSNILGRGGSVSLSVQSFAQDLTKFTGQGAQAWQNFAQVIGSTAPQLIDWLRTAGAMGTVSGTQFTTAVRAMVAQLLPFASRSKAAAEEVAALAQQAGGPGTDSIKKLRAWVDAGAHSQADLNGVITQGTIKMGDMAGVAQQLGNVIQQDLINMMGAAALKAAGASGAMVAYAKQIENGTAQTVAGQVARGKLITDLEKAGLTAQQATGYLKVMQAEIDGLHGKTINIQTNYTGGNPDAFKQPPSGPPRRTAAGTSSAMAGLSWVGEHGPELVNFRGGEQVIPHHMSMALASMAASARGYAAGTGGPSAALLAAAAGGGGQPIILHSDTTIKLDNEVIARKQRTEVSIYNRRNTGPNLSLRYR